MTKEKAVSLLSQMFLIQFSKEEHEALAMAIDALNADRKTENSSEIPNNCEDCIWSVCNYNKAFKDEPTISKMEQVDKDINVRSKDEPKICDTCRYYNSNIPCGSTPSACKEADKFAEEFVDGLKKLKPKTEPQTYVINPQEPTNDDKCFECDDFFTCDGQCDEVEDEPQTEPQTDCSWK